MAGYHYVFDFNVKSEYFLPLPFITKCFDYEENIGEEGKMNSFKSMKECQDKCYEKLRFYSTNNEQNGYVLEFIFQI